MLSLIGGDDDNSQLYIIIGFLVLAVIILPTIVYYLYNNNECEEQENCDVCPELLRVDGTSLNLDLNKNSSGDLITNFTIPANSYYTNGINNINFTPATGVCPTLNEQTNSALPVNIKKVNGLVTTDFSIPDGAYYPRGVPNKNVVLTVDKNVYSDECAPSGNPDNRTEISIDASYDDNGNLVLNGNQIAGNTHFTNANGIPIKINGISTKNDICDACDSCEECETCNSDYCSKNHPCSAGAESVYTDEYLTVDATYDNNGNLNLTNNKIMNDTHFLRNNGVSIKLSDASKANLKKGKICENNGQDCSNCLQDMGYVKPAENMKIKFAPIDNDMVRGSLVFGQKTYIDANEDNKMEFSNQFVLPSIDKIAYNKQFCEWGGLCMNFHDTDGNNNLKPWDDVAGLCENEPKIKYKFACKKDDDDREGSDHLIFQGTHNYPFNYENVQEKFNNKFKDGKVNPIGGKIQVKPNFNSELKRMPCRDGYSLRVRRGDKLGNNSGGFVDVTDQLKYIDTDGVVDNNAAYSGKTFAFYDPALDLISNEKCSKV